MSSDNCHQRPVRRDDVVLRPIGGEAMFYDSRTDQVVRLNAVARRILELCDGSSGVEEIEAVLRAEFDVPSEADLRKDVVSTLAQLTAAGVFQ